MEYNQAYEMFNDMMNFALRNGMVNYQSDLMHDAVRLVNTEIIGEPSEFMWVVKSDGCGTWLWNFKDGKLPETIANSGVNILIRYYGHCWVADFMKISNMTSEASGRKVANQFIIKDGNKTMFQSYRSPIVEIDRSNSTITVHPHWDYSNTTSKYRNQFMREEGLWEMSDRKGFENCMKVGKCGRFAVVEA